MIEGEPGPHARAPSSTSWRRSDGALTTGTGFAPDSVGSAPPSRICGVDPGRTTGPDLAYGTSTTRKRAALVIIRS